MFVFLKKTTGRQDTVISCENFQETSGCRIPRNSKIVVIDFRSQNHDSVTCCNKIQIFGDVGTSTVPPETTDLDQDNDFHEIESTVTTTWYQCSYIMKGFKDTTFNGSSITNAWLSS